MVRCKGEPFKHQWHDGWSAINTRWPIFNEKLVSQALRTKVPPHGSKKISTLLSEGSSDLKKRVSTGLRLPLCELQSWKTTSSQASNIGGKIQAKSAHHRVQMRTQTLPCSFLSERILSMDFFILMRNVSNYIQDGNTWPEVHPRGSCGGGVRQREDRL